MKFSSGKRSADFHLAVPSGESVLQRPIRGTEGERKARERCHGENAVREIGGSHEGSSVSVQRFQKD